MRGSCIDSECFSFSRIMIKSAFEYLIEKALCKDEKTLA